MTIPWTWAHKHHDGGYIGDERDIEIEARARLVGSEPEITITAIYWDRWDRVGRDFLDLGRENILRSSDPLLKAIGAAILNDLEDDEAFRERVISASGISHRGHPNDPASRWVQLREYA